ncbi:MAG: pyridoxine 5'-phosphate synthase, partial [Duncaniella sp.]|nr:pyridoxine 5'-phosphate synthase [Duncaniella sp.]
IELYTKHYADLYPTDPEAAVAPFAEAAEAALKCGLGVNAGHDLSLENLEWFHRHIPRLSEVSIGHALICDALYLGLEETIRRYRAALCH